MGHKIHTNDKNNVKVFVEIDKYPDQCPICHFAIAPMHILYFISGEAGLYKSLEFVFRCPRRECGKVFLSLYDVNVVGGIEYSYKESVPSTYKAPSLPETVRKISQSFDLIYSQAHQAELMNLKEICGAGYRKALEFLVKDFLLSKSSKIKEINRESIIKAPLAQCIEMYIDDQTTKQVAKRAAWLGNDETHYERKWTTKDLNDLKRLIHLTVNAIDSKIVADGYIDGMTAD